MHTAMELNKTLQDIKLGILPQYFCDYFPKLSDLINKMIMEDYKKRPSIQYINDEFLIIKN